MLANNYAYQYEHYQTPSTILFGQLRRWSIWLNRVSVLNQARCTPLVYLYIELVYTRVIASGEARLISPYIHILISIVYETMVFTGHCYLLLVIYLLQLYHCYLPFSEHSSYGSSNMLDDSRERGIGRSLNLVDLMLRVVSPRYSQLP